MWPLLFRLVLIVEGLTEQVLIKYLVKTNRLQVPPQGIFVREASGKFEIPRFMNLLHVFKIRHAVSTIVIPPESMKN